MTVALIETANSIFNEMTGLGDELNEDSNQNTFQFNKLIILISYINTTILVADTIGLIIGLINKDPISWSVFILKVTRWICIELVKRRCVST